MRFCSGLAALAALLSACSDRTEADAGNAAVAISPAARACSGERLPATGACTTPDASLFAAVDADRGVFAPECIWRTQEVAQGADTAILFRAQDCSAAGWPGVSYAWDSARGAVTITFPGDATGAGAVSMAAVQVFAVGAGETAETVASRQLAGAPDNERDHCAAKTLSETPAGLAIAGRAFELGPDAELRARIEAAAPDEPWNACGPHGVTMEAVQFWEGRDRHALFHMVGQDEPYWDPASFTFYSRGADGAWTLDE